MRTKIFAAAVLALFVAVPAIADDARSDAKKQVEFGIELAQLSLWRDATIRFERAVQIDPSYAEAWNDLGIGYEQLGRLEDARDAYDQALELAPTNQFILNNYTQFREIYDRQNVRRGGR
jgi:Flp pilus assembly protein TadD